MRFENFNGRQQFLQAVINFDAEALAQFQYIGARPMEVSMGHPNDNLSNPPARYKFPVAAIAPNAKSDCRVHAPALQIKFAIRRDRTAVMRSVPVVLQNQVAPVVRSVLQPWQFAGRCREDATRFRCEAVA